MQLYYNMAYQAISPACYLCYRSVFTNPLKIIFTITHAQFYQICS